MNPGHELEYYEPVIENAVFRSPVSHHASNNANYHSVVPHHLATNDPFHPEEKFRPRLGSGRFVFL